MENARYTFSQRMKTIEGNSNRWVKYAKSDSVVLDMLKQNYFHLQSEWEDICDYADENNIPTIHFWDQLMTVTDNLSYINDVIAEIENKTYLESMPMTKIEVSLGNNATFHGDFVVANSIKDSFNRIDSANIPDDLKANLKDLAIAVGEMSENLSDENAKQVVRDLETLTTEATSSSPRRQWWELSIEGIKKAAKDVGEIGKPVLDLIAKIVPLLVALSA